MNGNLTTASYDSLGRLSQVWLPDRLQSTHLTSPSIAYGYTDVAGAALAVSTTTLAPISTTPNVTSYALMDGLGRPIQTQQPMDSKNASTHQLGGTVLTDTYYDRAGRVVLTDNPFGSTAVNPSATRVNILTTIPSQNQTSYDGAGRVTATALIAADPVTGVIGPRWTTSYGYPGTDRVDETPPTGGSPVSTAGTATTTITDSRGRTVYLDQYLGATPSGSKERTSYGYDKASHLSSMTDNSGHAWSWSYDLLDRQVSATDPDTGTTTSTYDDAGNLTQTQDQSGNLLKYTYDPMNRQTGEYEWQIVGGVGGWAQDVARSYDSATLGKGLPYSATRYVGSTPTTLGDAYTKTVLSYNANGKAASTRVTVPNWAGATSTNFDSSLGYDVAGNLSTFTDAALGGLPFERLGNTYDLLDNLIKVAGDVQYLGDISYSHANQVSMLTLTNGNTQLDRIFTYDDGTGWLSRLQANTGAATGFHLADHQYSYDNAGEMLSDSNTADGQGTDTQCYSYDHLQELTSAWTPASNSCAAAPSSASLGGPAPYWTDYGYDQATGNRLSVTDHAITASGTDQQTSYSYPVGASVSQPHAVTDIATATAPAGSGTYTQTGTDHYSYDPSGRTLVRPGQTLSWDAEGHLASTTTSSGTQTNIYDADGSLLEQTDPVGGSTLYLGDTELHTAPGSTTVTGTRTYTANGMPLAERVGSSAAPAGSSTLYWLDSDGHGTAGSEVQALTLATTHRYADPFGNSRGSAPTWTSSHTFLNAPADTATGTVQLGAREYDPTLGRFLSVDPLLDPTDPGQVNGYSYASNDPVNASDPTGLMVDGEGGCDSASLRAAGSNTSCQQQATQNAVSSCSNGGSQDYCQAQSVGAGEGPGPSYGATVRGIREFLGAARSGAGMVVSAAVHHPAAFASELVGIPDIVKCFSGGGKAACALAAFDVATDVLAVGKVAKLAKLAELADAARAAKTRVAAKAADAGTGGVASVGRDAAQTCLTNSFTADTPVTMADGSKKLIDQVKVGDRVLATDPETGQSKAEPVVELIRHSGKHTMVLIGLADGSVLDSTDGHPIWDATTGQFTAADRLHPGDEIETSNGRLIAVTGLTTYSADLTAYNLQIEQIHTYYAGTTPVLVHNSCDEALAYALRQEQLDHVFFYPKHKLAGLVSDAGGKVQAMTQIIQSVGDVPDGVYGRTNPLVRQVGNYTVTIRGAMIGGTFKISTAFIP